MLFSSLAKDFLKTCGLTELSLTQIPWLNGFRNKKVFLLSRNDLSCLKNATLHLIWLVGSTDLKNMSQNGFIFPKIWGENKKSLSYHLVIFYPFPFYVIIACFFLRISPLSLRKPTIRTPNLQVLQQGLLFFGGRFQSSLFIQFMSWSMLCFQFWTPTTGTFINCWPVFPTVVWPWRVVFFGGWVGVLFS